MVDSKECVFVTGVTGTVGSEVAARLVEEGYAVRALVRRTSAAKVEELGVELAFGDLTDKDAVERAVQGVQAVVHSAAYIGSDWEKARSVNVEGTANVANAALAAGVERLVHISTGSVYDSGSRVEISEEETPLCEASKSAYAQTKADAERAVRAAAEKGLEIAILRLGMVLSAHHTSVWGPKLIENMRSGMEWHSEDCVNWVHVKNIPDAVLLLMRAPEAVGEAFNLVDGVRPAREFYGRVAAWLEQSHTEPDRSPRVRHVLTEKIRSLGYEPRHTFEEALIELEQVARSNGWLAS